ncbi:unnamed protein product, partial [Prorocentrum cordatum]
TLRFRIPIRRRCRRPPHNRPLEVEWQIAVDGPALGRSAVGQRPGPLERVPGHQLGLPRPGRGPRRGPGARALRSVAAVVGAVRGDAGRRRRRGPGPGGGRAARVVLHAAHGFQLLRHSALPQALPRRVRGPPCGDARPARRRPRPAPLPRRGRAALAGGAAEAMAAVPPGDEVAHGRRVVGCIRGRVPGGAGARGLQHRVRRRRSQRAGGSGRPVRRPATRRSGPSP